MIPAFLITRTGCYLPRWPCSTGSKKSAERYFGRWRRAKTVLMASEAVRRLPPQPGSPSSRCDNSQPAQVIAALSRPIATPRARSRVCAPARRGIHFGPGQFPEIQVR